MDAIQKYGTPDEESRERELRKTWRMCCPECWHVDALQVQTRIWVRVIASQPVTELRGEFVHDDEARCSCGWEGSVSDLEDAYRLCCKRCGEDPRNMTNEDGWKVCHNCGAER